VNRHVVFIHRIFPGVIADAGKHFYLTVAANTTMTGPRFFAGQ
jgi:hypothetical protein